ncbi:hypothetical protein E4T56_gene18699 [Termitomyces sp. T112]|nr:hypothetical protein E4T56_gene18699 [Termitomyces sp. T112]
MFDDNMSKLTSLKLKENLPTGDTQPFKNTVADARKRILPQEKPSHEKLPSNADRGKKRPVIKYLPKIHLPLCNGGKGGKPDEPAAPTPKQPNGGGTSAPNVKGPKITQRS